MKNDLVAEILMESNFLDKLFQKTIASKISIGMILFATYIGCSYHQTFNRVYDYFINHNVQINQGYFQDPRGLEIEIDRNEGRREVYITYENKKVPIGYDLMPPTDSLIDGLERRMLNTDEKEYIRKRLKDIID